MDYRLLSASDDEEALKLRNVKELQIKIYFRNIQGSDFEKQRLVEQTEEVQGKIKSYVRITNTSTFSFLSLQQH